MTQTHLRSVLAPLTAAILALASAVEAQDPNPNIWYRLTTLFQGDNVAMDVINDGNNNNRMIMVPAGAYSGQYWRFTPIVGFPGRFRISCMWQGENLPMDIINGGPDNNFPILAPIGPYNGQFWSLIPVTGSPGYFFLQTDFRGPGLSLEGFAGQTQDRPQLLPTGFFTGMMWKLTPLLSINPATSISFGTGCQGRGGVPSLSLTNEPWIGETMTGGISNVPSNTICQLVIGARLPNPIDLGFIQSPGCRLYVDLTIRLTLAIQNGAGVIAIPTPNNLNFVGLTLPIQGVVIDPGNRPLIATSNALDLVYGLR